VSRRRRFTGGRAGQTAGKYQRGRENRPDQCRSKLVVDVMVTGTGLPAQVAGL
jgi:hypothetical protein